jgi:hypothetical protein
MNIVKSETIDKMNHDQKIKKKIDQNLINMEAAPPKPTKAKSAIKIIQRGRRGPMVNQKMQDMINQLKEINEKPKCEFNEWKDSTKNILCTAVCYYDNSANKDNLKSSLLQSQDLNTILQNKIGRIEIQNELIVAILTILTKYIESKI